MKAAKDLRRPTLIVADPRLEDHWKKISLKDLPKSAANGEVLILSYPDDEGVRLNRGRPGADRGPERIVHYLGRAIYQGSSTPDVFLLSDQFKQDSLNARHEAAEKTVLQMLQAGFRVITLGGGHDYGFPDASAYFQACRGTILNVDAHLDVRPVAEGKLKSGTPFFRFVERFGGKHLVEWGIQEQCNALLHVQYAFQNKIKVASYREPMPKIRGPVGLSICLDAFQGIRGVSAPAVVGLVTDQGVATVEHYARESRWLGVYECAPIYDPQNEDSARFGALLAYRFIHTESVGKKYESHFL